MAHISYEQWKDVTVQYFIYVLRYSIVSNTHCGCSPWATDCSTTSGIERRVKKLNSKLITQGIKLSTDQLLLVDFLLNHGHLAFSIVVRLDQKCRGSLDFSIRFQFGSLWSCWLRLKSNSNRNSFSCQPQCHCLCTTASSTSESESDEISMISCSGWSSLSASLSLWPSPMFSSLLTVTFGWK